MVFLITLGGWIECLKIRLKRSMKDEKKNPIPHLLINILSFCIN